MKIFTPEISWHERDPIYTCAFHPFKANKFSTAGVTGVIRLWELTEKEDSTATLLPLSACESGTAAKKSSVDLEVSFVANLRRHNKSVNVVRWNHDGQLLASAGDESVIFVWKENDIKNQKTLDNDEDESRENWYSFKTFRGHLEDILDLSWSSDSSTLVSGSVDNSVIVWNVATGAKVAILKEPKGFVQGVICDPLGATFAILSTDRCLRIYSSTNYKCLFNVNKIQLNKESSAPVKPDTTLTNTAPTSTTVVTTTPTEATTTTTALTTAPVQNVRIFHDDTMKSFFRRMCFSPDGLLLFAPAGCLEMGEKMMNTSYIFARNSYTKPCVYIPHDRPSVAISCCPLKFELQKKENMADIDENADASAILFNLDYRYVFAVATEDSVYFYDTQSLAPFAQVTGIHYSNISDISWSSTGRMLIVSSIDGFMTFITFRLCELGTVVPETPVSTQQNVEQKPESIDMATTNTNTMV